MVGRNTALCMHQTRDFAKFRSRYVYMVKYELLKGVLLFTFSFEENSDTQGFESLSRKIRIYRAANIKDFVILACTVLIKYSSVTNRRTDRQTL